MFHDFGRDRHDRHDDDWRYDEAPRFDDRREHSARDGRPYDEERSWAEPGDGYGREMRDERPRREDPRYVEAREHDGRRDVRDDGDDRRERARDDWDFGRTDRRYSLKDTRRMLPREETERLIASDKVEGAPVYDLHGRRVGEVHNFMVDKRSGQVEYAVVRVRGGLFSGEAYRPVAWRDLDYDERLDGYQVDVERRELRHDRSFEERR
ncbi:PRC-barrel domain-containing protein [Brevundimonas sp.]|uniref:PRC-barrel domain-containing protein n=1 Tax=Brevundimonas sp. TaxID=1871086 RepID=UPI0025CFC965|nr:PRC-barrel domain-containing protein [Brevundimonas sp.]